jgi:two-component system osmolarity sensor histidine kinase EnvZ
MMRGDDDLRTTAMRQVDRIEAMLVQFLDFARGFETETPRQTDLAALLRQIVADSGAEDVVEVVAVERLSIATRAHALSRAVSNLLANALRHGAPPVRVEARSVGEAVTIVVSDAGTGMSATDSEALTRPFARGDIARGGDGAGLGLAIAQRAVAAIDGQLMFRHRDGRFEAIISFEGR